MIVRAINHENLYIDGDFKDIEDLKAKIALKYGIPTSSQSIVFNGRAYVLGIFDFPLESHSDTYENPLGCFGCPDTIFNDFASSGMTINEIRAHAFPHKEDLKEEILPLPKAIDIKSIAKKVVEGQYEEISKIPEGLEEEEKTAIMENLGEYIDLILKQANDSTFLDTIC
ncbi:hypothetical protein KMI_12g18030 [Encephalitozoon hellem]|nr:hypothetical protein KMI_12g18030 [Encephalitozoon hellem]